MVDAPGVRVLVRMDASQCRSAVNRTAHLQTRKKKYQLFSLNCSIASLLLCYSFVFPAVFSQILECNLVPEPRNDHSISAGS